MGLQYIRKLFRFIANFRAVRRHATYEAVPLTSSPVLLQLIYINKAGILHYTCKKFWNLESLVVFLF